MAFQFDPRDFDPKRTYTDLEPYLVRLGSERQRANLQTVIDHARGEVERDLDLILGTLQDDAEYHFWSWRSTEDAPKGNASIRAYYEYYVASGQACIESRKIRVSVSDDLVCTENLVTNIHSGEIAVMYGFEIDEKDAVYATRMRNLVLWSMDEHAKTRGEDAYTWRCPADFVKLAARDVPRPYLDYMAEIGLEVPGR
jgi:hypothetical protein